QSSDLPRPSVATMPGPRHFLDAPRLPPYSPGVPPVAGEACRGHQAARASDPHWCEMTPTRSVVVSVLTALAFLGEALACTVPQSGYNMDMDDLIAEANTIVLVRLRSVQSSSPELDSVVRLGGR